MDCGGVAVGIKGDKDNDLDYDYNYNLDYDIDIATNFSAPVHLCRSDPNSPSILEGVAVGRGSNMQIFPC